MAVRSALVIINGQIQQLPSGDTLAGATGSGSSFISREASADVTVPSFQALYIPDEYIIDAGVNVEVAANGVLEVG